MAIGLYDTRAMLKAIEQFPREYSFLYDTFCRDGGTVEDDKAIYDYRKGAIQMAPFVVPGTGGILMNRYGYETREIGFCTIAPERVVTLEDISQRSFGEAILGAMTPDQRSKKMLARDMMDLRQMIQRRREWMARQVLLTGKLDIHRWTQEGRDKNTTLVADYKFTNTYTPATPWGQPGANIGYDLQQIFDIVYEGLGMAEIIVMDPDSAEAIFNDEKIYRSMDARNIDMGAIQTKYRGQGVRFIGWTRDGVEMYSFAGKFVDEDHTVKPILPRGTLICGARGVLNAIHGPITLVEGKEHTTYIKREVPQRIADEPSNSVKNRITSRPTIVPFNVDAWVVANVL